MIRYNTDCPYLRDRYLLDIFDQYCKLLNKNCDKHDCEVLKILKENEQLKAQIKNLKEGEQYETCPYRSTDMGCDYYDYRDRDLKDEVINDR